ncbi:hypothetical protein IE53DRAFT_384747 [Violaceomyces palustris]|uniref:Uncharacterized protein n=1 Tax=Violaceomyces palustris TaxID=1673888 RepID=A0ACD0P474_9BASI|nr:hypothetical protein IE53DRAFT_384747 [Violaceomyces palustris]
MRKSASSPIEASIERDRPLPRRRSRAGPGPLPILLLDRLLVGANPNVQFFRLVWLVSILWAERFTFHKAVYNCQWPSYPATSKDADDRSFKVLILTDPQIIDEFTYKELSWPLSRMAQFFSDTYLSKVWKALVTKDLTARAWGRRPAWPDMIVWMGDLTDNGRRHMTDEEWESLHSRFSRLFPIPGPIFTGDVSPILGKRKSPGSFLPVIFMAGNHDLGLPKARGQTVSEYLDPRAKGRFSGHFGLPVDKDGFLTSGPTANDNSSPQDDTRRQFKKWSLNARVLITLDGTQGSGKPTHELIIVNAQDLVGMQRVGGPFSSRLPSNSGKLEGPLLEDAKERFRETYRFVEELGHDSARDMGLARILFSHVPLYREWDVKGCDLPSRYSSHGVRREADLSKSDREARGIRQGTDRYSTYQNLLGKEVSSWLLENIRPSAVFSGDDHDHCERVHSVDDASHPSDRGRVDGFRAGEIPELTVKSISMTEGVRKPGFARLSLFPPPAPSSSATPSMSYVPCTLPDQIGIWTGLYIPLFVLTIIFVSVCRKYGWTMPVWSTGMSKLKSDGTRSRRGGPNGRYGDRYEAVDLEEADWDGESLHRQRERSRGYALPTKAKGVARSVLEDILLIAIVAFPFWLLLQVT